MPSPRTAMPMKRVRSFLANKYTIAEAPMIIAPYFETAGSVRIQSDSVVPMFAPKMTPIACISVIRPLLTNPTTMTVVAELDWMMQVTPMPTRMPTSLLSVTAWIQRLSLLPASACMPSERSFIPRRKMPRPPRTVWVISAACAVIAESCSAFVCR